MQAGRRPREAGLRAHESTQAFLLALSDALRRADDPASAQQAAVRRVAERFGASRVAYYELDDDQDGFVQAAGVESPDAVALPHHMRLSDYGGFIEAEYRAGRTIRVDDVDTDPQTAPYRDAHRAIGVRAWVGVPLLRKGRLAVILGVHSAAPRAWSRAEVALLEDVAVRTWAAAEHARAERALRESEAKYRALFDRMAEGYAIVELVRDEAGGVADVVFLEMNQAFARQLVPPDAQRPHRADPPVIDLRPWLAHFARAATTGETAYFEGRLDASARWYEVSAHPQDDDRLSVFCRDVTARKRAEDTLRASQERLQRMINIDGVGVLSFARDGTLLDANGTFLQMLGYDREDLASGAMNWRMLTPQPWVAESERQMGLLAQTGRIGPYRKEYLRKDGTRAWLLFAGAALGDGTIVEYCIDVSGQRRSESRYQSLFASIEQGFCIVEAILDAQGRGVDYRFLEINPAFERHTGMVDAVGRTMREMVPDLEPHWPEIYGRVATTGVREGFVSHSEAMGRWFEVDAFRIGEPDERQVAILFSDISERVHAGRRQQESDRRKDEFLAVLGHELRNPLAPIRSSLDLLGRVPHQPAMLDRLLPMMGRQVTHLTRLVDDLLDMSRISRGNIALRRAPVDLNDAVDAAVEQVQDLMSTRRHALHVHIAPVPLPLLGDADRLTQIVANLLSNAAKYSRPASTVTVRTAAEAGLAVLRVTDTGHGIPPERLGELFEMFMQVPEHRHLDGGSGGLGIGLALVRQLVRMHGGTITAHSEGLGRGSEFVVRLPLSQDAPATVTPASARPADAPRRILVVDDNVDAAVSLGMLLQDHGHQVEMASNGPSALEQLQRFRPQTVLLDIGMPGWDGIEVARRIREQLGSEAVQLVAVTGWGQDKDRYRTETAGFDHHLTKPVALTELLAVMQRGPAARPDAPSQDFRST